jgi:predicted nucleotidyltransferase
MKIENLLKEKRSEILRIAEKYGAQNVRVFGSVARGESSESSDVDFLVQFSPGVTLLNHNALVRELETLLGGKVDVVSERGLKARIKERILKEAIPL